ncbi:MAG: glycosyltransferase [Gammaproteobacteria bacterium]|nr:glycosyltransferase [Gammaproteobacteria bacterium]
MTATLSVIVPVLNEAKNISILVEKLDAALAGLEWEVVFVDDDSSDGSRDTLIDLSRCNRRVRFLSRVGRQGLSSAVIEGAMSCASDHIAVMDGDLQHDEKVLPKMRRVLVDEGADVVVGSRFLERSELGTFSQTRERISRVGNWLSGTVIKTQLSDPLSGFFMARREVFESVVRNLAGTGFKILLDILASSKRPLKVVELPFTFGTRLHGESKVDSLVTLEFGMMLLNKWFGGWIPIRFMLFSLVGGLGVISHLIILAGLYRVVETEFIYAQAAATLITMAINFVLNNLFTYRDKRLTGLSFFMGLASFYLVCSIGALANFQFAEFLYQQQLHWALAGFSGAMVGAVWNYAMSSVFTWRKTR